MGVIEQAIITTTVKSYIAIGIKVTVTLPERAYASAGATIPIGRRITIAISTCKTEMETEILLLEQQSQSVDGLQSQLVPAA